MKNKGKLLKRLELKQGFIEVRENRNYRWMLFDKHVIQTLINKNYPHESNLNHITVLMKGFNFIEKPQKVLILGLGGGALIHSIHAHYPGVHITAVEISEEVILLAHDFFYLPNQSELCSIIHADAYRYLLETTGSFDLVFVDMYSDNKLPDGYFKEDFHQSISQQLSAKGVAIYNLLCYSSQEFEEILKQIRLVFHCQTLCIPVNKFQNVIIYAFKDYNYKTKLYSLGDSKILTKLEHDLILGLIANFA